jgi:hypothetical protein
MKMSKRDKEKIRSMEEHRKEVEQRARLDEQAYEAQHGFTLREYVDYLINYEKLQKMKK